MHRELVVKLFVKMETMMPGPRQLLAPDDTQEVEQQWLNSGFVLCKMCVRMIKFNSDPIKV